MDTIELPFGELQVSWQGEGLLAKPKITVARNCLLECSGKHTLRFTVFGELGKYQLSEKATRSSLCPICGNHAGLTGQMVTEIIKQVTAWAKPYVENHIQERKTRRDLWGYLAGKDGNRRRVHPDIWDSAHEAHVDILRVFEEVAHGEDEELAQFFTGDWAEVITKRLRPYMPDKAESTWDAPWRDHPTWRALLHKVGTEEERRATANTFYLVWHRSSGRGLFGRTGKMTDNNAVAWMIETYLAKNRSEAIYLLDRLVGNGFPLDDRRAFTMHKQLAKGAWTYQLTTFDLPAQN